MIGGVDGIGGDGGSGGRLDFYRPTEVEKMFYPSFFSHSLSQFIILHPFSSPPLFLVFLSNMWKALQGVWERNACVES